MDILVTGTFKSPSNILREARETLSPVLLSLFHNLIESFNYEVPFSDALRSILRDRKLDSLTPEQQDALEKYLWPWVDKYVRNKSRQRAMWSLPKEARIVISGRGDWEVLSKRIPDSLLLPPMDFTDTLSVMKQSKLILNVSPSLSDGGHERVFYGLMTGAIVLTNSTPYLEEIFRDGHNILFLGDSPRDDAERVRAYLEHSRKRHSVAAAGQQVVIQGHTWAHRVDTLLHTLDARRSN